MRALLSSAVLLAAALPVCGFETPRVSTEEPRAFGYSVGDVVTRVVTIDVPARLALDRDSLPKHGRRGKAIELRTVEWRESSLAGGQRHVLRLDYQVFVAPREVRSFELPPLVLRLAGARDEEVRIDAWPLVVAPLAPVEASPRSGLGELRPDLPPPLIDTAAARTRLALYAVVLGSLLAYLAFVYLGVPWWNRRHRPFGAAWRTLRSLRDSDPPARRQAALQSVHDAFNRTAGHVLFAPGIDRFIARHPRYAHLQGDIAAFFARSNDAFFAGGAAHEDARWLIDFSRRMRDAERGA